VSAESRTPAQRAGEIVRATEAAAAAAASTAGPPKPPKPPKPPAAAPDARAVPARGTPAAADELDAQLARARSQLDALEAAVDRLAHADAPGH
jgi:hypothetical protein